MVATSLDYAGCEAALRLAGFAMTKEIFQGLQVMETAAISAMSER